MFDFLKQSTALLTLLNVPWVKLAKGIHLGSDQKIEVEAATFKDGPQKFLFAAEITWMQSYTSNLVVKRPYSLLLSYIS